MAMVSRLLIVLALALGPSILQAQTADSLARSILDESEETNTSSEDLIDELESLYSYITPSSGQIRVRMSQDLGSYDLKGYTQGSFLGNPLDVRSRARLQTSLLGLGCSQTKQSWEPRMLDQWRGYLTIRRPIPVVAGLSLRSAVAGDYALAIGQGLVFGDAMSATVSAAAAQHIATPKFGIRPSLGMGMRGLALTMAGSKYKLTASISGQRVGARVEDDTIRSLRTDDYHRTLTESEAANAAGLSVAGACMEYDDSTFHVGGAGYRGMYDAPVVTDSRANLNGDRWHVASAFADYRTGAVLLNGEVASSWKPERGTGGMISAIIKPSRTFALVASYQYYDSDFYSPFGSAIDGFGLELNDRHTFYLGAQLQLPGHATLDLYSETLGGNRLSTTQKRSYLAALVYPFEVGSLLRLLYRHTTHSVLDTAREATQDNFRVEAYYDATTDLHLQSRLGGVLVRDHAAPRTGLLLLQGVNYKGHTLDLGVRAARFVTDDYTSRVYVYDAPLSGAGALFPLYDKGFYLRASLEYHEWSGVEIAGCIDGILYDSERSLGSGVTARTSRHDVSVSFQISITP